ncbi:hypothetical protein M409DRAFT_54958 [Zasmidium cellare ATCC 36951]|uniref:Uncharacterized protein n=1 Tax=Zasmidium cellare ATCC 36951 TaxID=1080233 RepID=A0A6A6CHY3_ZASCE|nr:uncharacterized protein M409DRAFT_54958 [Zasmidium cellare ATCC 36951]KAF2166631.1 hypothetical protein M409DRAFT_54958 [Zasmidium cellare ATCC 36951]
MADSTKHSSRLTRRKVLIFGGTSGLGYGAAEACIENGMTVVIASSSEAKINTSIERILESYPSARDQVSGHVCDIGNRTTLEDNIVGLFEKIGKVDHIIYTAGSPLDTVTLPLEQITVDSAIESHIIRYFAPMILGKHAKKYLSPGPYSSITFTSGTIALRPRIGWVLANGVMAAVEGLTKALALELAPIRVNIVQPGAVGTEMWDILGEEAVKGLKASVETNAPTKRLAQPEDIAESYIYTLRDINLTGAVIKTDSGADLK